MGEKCNRTHQKCAVPGDRLTSPSCFANRPLSTIIYQSAFKTITQSVERRLETVPSLPCRFPSVCELLQWGKSGSRAIYFIYNCKKQAGCTGAQWHVLSGFPSVDRSPLLRFDTVDSAALTHSAILIKPFHNTNAYLLVGLTVIICQTFRFQKALKLSISLCLKFRFKMQLTSDLNRK